MKTQIYLMRCNLKDRRLAAKLLFDSPLPQDYRAGAALYHAMPIRIDAADLLQAAESLPATSLSLRKKLKLLAKLLSEMEKAEIAGE